MTRMLHLKGVNLSKVFEVCSNCSKSLSHAAFVGSALSVVILLSFLHAKKQKKQPRNVSEEMMSSMKVTGKHSCIFASARLHYGL